MSRPVAWRLIVAAGVLTALMNSLGACTSVRIRVLPGGGEPLPSIMAYVVSGILGLTRLSCPSCPSRFRIRGRVMHLN